MDLWYRLCGPGQDAGVRKALALAGARPLGDGLLPPSGQLILAPSGGPPLTATTLLAMLQTHLQRGATVTLALPAGQEPVGLEGAPIAQVPMPAVADLGRLGPEAHLFLDDPARLWDWARVQGAPVGLWRQTGETETDSRRDRIARLVAAGVAVLDPMTTWVDTATEVAAGATLLPFTTIEGACVIGPGCRIGPGTHLRASRLGRGVHIWYSVVEEADLGDGVEIGPYAHLRPGCVLETGVRVGNFVEVKNARVGAHARLPHHAYMGEVDIGAGANIGAGAVVVNYDGRRKRRARIGAGAMVGCNANVIAPAVIGENGYVAAGSSITEDVPEGGLALARGRQHNVEGWVARRLGPGTASGIEAPAGSGSHVP